MLLEEKPSWDKIEKCVEYLSEKGLTVNYSLIFDQAINLNNVFDTIKDNEHFSNLSADLKWVKYFEGRNKTTSSEFQKITSFFFAIPTHNANVERIFSMMKRTDVQFNFKN